MGRNRCLSSTYEFGDDLVFQRLQNGSTQAFAQSLQRTVQCGGTGIVVDY